MVDLLIRNVVVVVIVIESVEISIHSVRFHKGICVISHTGVFVPFSLMAFVISFLWAYSIHLFAISYCGLPAFEQTSSFPSHRSIGSYLMDAPEIFLLR